MEQRWIIADAAGAATQLRRLAARLGIDEVMVSPAASARAADDPRTSPGASAYAGTAGRRTSHGVIYERIAGDSLENESDF